jgi:tetratricopeptide (TPR) repeat protein
MPLSGLEKLFEDGLAALRRDRFSEAADHFSAAMEIDPEMPQIHYNMGLALGRLFRWRDALACFRMAIRIQPHPDAWVHSGLANLHLRNWDEALEAFEEALALEPNSEVARAHRDDLREFFALEQRSPASCPFLCTGWFDPRLESYAGVDPVIVPKARRRELREFLARELAEAPCDHTHAATEEWSLRNGLDPLGVSRFLFERGLRCDCKVLGEGERT